MGTKDNEAPEGGTTAVTTTSGSAMPAFMQERVAQDAGKGTSQLADDNLVPMIYILQPLSPQVLKKNPEYIEGAEAGDIWLKNYGVVKGGDGIVAQPVYFYKQFVEWRPNRGGFVTAHDAMPEDAVEKNVAQQGEDEKMAWVRPNGNHVVETRYHVVIVHMPDGARMPYVMPMAGSMHTVSRGWMARMNTKVVGDGVAPSWSFLYRLKEKGRSNQKGEWFVYDVADEGWVQTEQDYVRGSKLYESFTSGELRAEAPQDAAGGGEASGTPDNNGAM